jgi:hypothetical protein
MRFTALLLAGLPLAACSAEPAANKSAQATTTSVSPDGPPRYVGRWAAREELCAEGAWRFEAMDLSTAGEVSCDFRRVEEVPGGYDVDATCHAEGSQTDEVIKLRFAESAAKDNGAMLVASKTFQPIELIRCSGD